MFTKSPQVDRVATPVIPALKAEAGRSRVLGQPGLQSQILSQKKQKNSVIKEMVKMVNFILHIF
jgi:hypothetical protein